LDKWLEIFTHAFASNSFAQEVGPIGRSLPFISTHVMTSSGLDYAMIFNIRWYFYC
jgi:hypothetical protein